MRGLCATISIHTKCDFCDAQRRRNSPRSFPKFSGIFFFFSKKPPFSGPALVACEQYKELRPQSIIKPCLLDAGRFSNDRCVRFHRDGLIKKRFQVLARSDWRGKDVTWRSKNGKNFQKRPPLNKQNCVRAKKSSTSTRTKCVFYKFVLVRAHV